MVVMIIGPISCVYNLLHEDYGYQQILNGKYIIQKRYIIVYNPKGPF